MTLNEAIQQFSEIGRGDDLQASQARVLAAWLKELRELRNKMRVVEAIFGKGQIDSLRREMKKMQAAAGNVPPAAATATVETQPEESKPKKAFMG